MTTEVKVPMLPESVSDATIATWHKKAGEAVTRGENLVDLETDKVMLEVPATEDGILKQILKGNGEVVQADQVLAIIESGQATKKSPAESENANTKKDSPEKTASEKNTGSNKSHEDSLSPSVRRVIAEHDVNVSDVKGTGKDGRITKENAIAAVKSTSIASQDAKTPNAQSVSPSGRTEKRVPMTRMRMRIAERLLEVSQNTAMLTTFNEVDLTNVLDIRSKYKDKFEKTHNTRLGFMSFFVKAAVEALKRSPAVNASIDGQDIVYHGFYDIGVAVSTDRGLVVPVLRDADKMSMADIEANIAEFATKARNGKLTMEEMQGGTFTITNGGVFGSLLSTPILNSPQSAILGMHKIEQRAVVVNNQIVIRSMMYLAMSYDHRIIDGKESVTFLVNIKELLEDPARLLLEV